MLDTISQDLLDQVSRTLEESSKTSVQKVVQLLKAIDKKSGADAAKKAYKDWIALENPSKQDIEKVNSLFFEENQLNEIAVDIRHDRYVRSHGTKAKGTAQWAFTVKKLGDVDYDNKKEVYFHRTTDTLAKAAQAAAKALNSRHVYVMEATNV